MCSLEKFNLVRNLIVTCSIQMNFPEHWGISKEMVVITENVRLKIAGEDSIVLITTMFKSF